jgi:hypothetical protein
MGGGIMVPDPVKQSSLVLLFLGIVATVGCAPGGGGGAGNVNQNGAGNANANGNLNVNGNDNSAPIDNDNIVSGFVEVPDPLSGDNPTYKLIPASVPAPGESVTDSRFGTVQTRVVQTESLRHEYSRFDPFNRDQSLVVLTYFPDGEWRVYRTQTIPYDRSENLVTTLDLEDPRWDPNDADLIWGLREFRIVTVNVQTNQTTTVKDFAQDSTISPILAANPDLYRITMMNEGESSTDKRFWAFMLQGTSEDYRPRHIFTWDRQQDQVSGVYQLSAAESEIDWVGMSPLGNWVLIGGDSTNGGNLGPGLLMANRELTQFHQLAPSTAHSDVGLDSDGNEVIVMQNTQTDHIDLIPLEVGAAPVPLVILFYDSESPIGFHGGIHISCNVPGYCVVSTEVEAGVPEQNWLDRTITLVRLDRSAPRVFYLAKVYGSTGAYWEETQATISNDGAKVVWATNWSQNVGQERVWVVQLDMPTGWMNALNGQP